MAFFFVHTYDIWIKQGPTMIFCFVSGRFSCCSGSPQTYKTAEANPEWVILRPLTYNC